MRDNPLQRCVRGERLFLIEDLQAGLCLTCYNGHLSQTAVDLAKQLRDLPEEANLFAWSQRIQAVIQQTADKRDAARRWAHVWKRLVKKMGCVIRNYRTGQIYQVQQERIEALEAENRKLVAVARAATELWRHAKLDLLDGWLVEGDDIHALRHELLKCETMLRLATRDSASKGNRP